LEGCRAGWKAVFPNEKREFSVGWQAAQKGSPAGCGKEQGRLQKRAAL